MILPGLKCNLVISTHACANGEIVECRLSAVNVYTGDIDVLETTFVTGETTNFRTVVSSLFRNLSHR